MDREYRYVGPSTIRDDARGQPPGTVIGSPTDLAAWLGAVGVAEDTVTYTVGTDRRLRIADRHSEHVACAEGGPVLAAGELGIAVEGGVAVVVSVSNQSTGFCPEPVSLRVVEDVLAQIGLAMPSTAAAYDFRRCPGCGAIHLVKDEEYVCACGSALPEAWNLDEG